jgi:hypothetical protein
MFKCFCTQRYEHLWELHNGTELESKIVMQRIVSALGLFSIEECRLLECCAAWLE